MRRASMLVLLTGCARAHDVAPVAHALSVAATAPVATSAPAGRETIATDAPLPPPSPGLGGTCHDGWCWEDPLPTGDDLVDVVADGPQKVWIAAVAPGGSTVFHGDPRRLATIAVKRRITALARAGANDLWAATREGVLLHGDGTAFQEVDAGNTRPLTSICARDARDAWAVGEEGVLLHWDGKAWTRALSPTTATLYSVRGRASGDVWAGGDGVILHWNGQSWSIARRLDEGPKKQSLGKEEEGGFCGTPGMLTEMYNQSLMQVGSILPLSANDVWALGGYGRALHFDGRKWTERDLGMAVHTLWASSPRDVWAVGSGVARFNGTTWTKTARPNDESLRSVHGTSPTDVWAAGQLGVILHHDGHAWSHVDVGARVRLHALWVGSGGSAWASGDGGALLRRDRTGWHHVTVPLEPRAEIQAIGGASDSDLWAFPGAGRPLRWDGKRWTVFEGPAAVRAFTVRAPAPDDVWAIAASLVQHWDGKTWTDLSKGEFGIADLWAPAKGIAWATAHPVDPTRSRRPDGAQSYDYGKTVLVRWDGARFVEVAAIERPSWTGIGGAGTSDVWVAGEKVVRWDGAAFATIFDPPVDPREASVSRTRRLDVVSGAHAFVSGQGDVFHYDGKTWSLERVAITNARLEVRGSDAYAFGSYGGIMHRER